MQSVATTMSDMHSAAGDMTLDADASVMTTTSVATSQGGKKGRARKAATAKTRKTKVKKDEAVEILEDSEAPPPPPPKPTRGRKRGSEEVEDSIVMTVEVPAPKRRATRGKVSDAMADKTATMMADAQDTDMGDAPPAPPAKQPAGRKKGRASNAKTTTTTTTRKASATSLKAKASTASLRAQAAAALDDDDLERQLQADLERPLTEDEYMTADSESERTKPAAPPAGKATAKKSASSSRKATARNQQEHQRDDYAMFDPAPVPDDDAQVEEELRALETEMNAEQEREQEPLEVPKKGRKTGGTRKASKQTRKAKAAAPPPPPEPAAEEQPEVEEDSIVVSSVAPEPEAAVLEDPDTSSGTVVNKTEASRPAAAATATAVAKPRGRPKKNSAVSQPVIAEQAEPEPTDAATATPQPDDAVSVVVGPPVPSSHPLTSTAQAQQTQTQSHSQHSRNVNKSLPPPPPPSPPPQSEKPTAAQQPQPQPQPPATPRRLAANRTTGAHPSASANAKQATLSPSQSPQSSDAENRPPSSRPAGGSSGAAKRVVLAPPVPALVPPATPGGRNGNAYASPSRRNVVAGLRSAQPWRAVDLDLVFALVGEGEERGEVDVDGLLRRGGAELSTPERDMTVEEWIFYNAGLAEQMLKAECEGMVSKFEVEGGRAMRVLEGLVVE